MREFGSVIRFVLRGSFVYTIAVRGIMHYIYYAACIAANDNAI